MVSWAKAPRLDEAARAVTAEEIREFLAAGLTPISCHSCATRVLVRKSSPAHTSVQWTTDPAASCPEFAARVAGGELGARIDTCPKLRASIELAVIEGHIEVPDG
jgi:hypothetical protein